MTTTSSRLALTVTATHRGAGKEAFVHLSRGDSLAMIPLLIFELPAGSHAGLRSWRRHRWARSKARMTRNRDCRGVGVAH